MLKRKGIWFLIWFECNVKFYLMWPWHGHPPKNKNNKQLYYLRKSRILHVYIPLFKIYVRIHAYIYIHIYEVLLCILWSEESRQRKRSFYKEIPNKNPIVSKLIYCWIFYILLHFKLIQVYECWEVCMWGGRQIARLS